MPYVTQYSPAEVFMEHCGITIYHVYKDNDPDQGCREFWFDTREDSQDEGGFDIRDLAYELRLTTEATVLDNVTNDDVKKLILKAAIDAGLVQTPKAKSRRRKTVRPLKN